MANLAFPGTAGFPGEFAVLYSVFSFAPSIAFISLVGVFLAGVSTIWMYCRVMFGAPSHNIFSIVTGVSDVSFREVNVLGSKLWCVVVLGIYPQFIFNFAFV